MIYGGLMGAMWKIRSSIFGEAVEYAAILGMHLSCMVQKHVGMVQMITFLFLIPKSLVSILTDDHR